MIELEKWETSAPDGSVIGVLTNDPAAVTGNALRISQGEELPETARALILDHTFSQMPLLQKIQALSQLSRMAKNGATIILISHDEAILERAADEIWVIEANRLIDRGDPGEVLSRYRERVARELRLVGNGAAMALSPTMRKGDGRASVSAIEMPSSVLTSGEEAFVRVQIDYLDHVADPVVGIMIRTRIGLNVYGTNTELESLRFGPVNSGDRRTITFRFRFDLCPGDYTITAASHDPDGLWHEWLEDAVAFNVTDSRYTAGVANLRARVSVE